MDAGDVMALPMRGGDHADDLVECQGRGVDNPGVGRSRRTRLIPGDTTRLYTPRGYFAGEQ